MSRSLIFCTLALLSAIAAFADESKSGSSSAVSIPLSEIVGLGPRGLRVLEPDLFVYRDTPEKIAKYSTPEGMEEARKLAAKSLVILIERAMDRDMVNSC